LAPWGASAFLAIGFGGETAAVVGGAAHEARLPSGPATMADEQPGGSLLAFAMADGTVTLRDMSGGVEDRVLTVSERRVVKARFSPDGAHIATVSEGGDLTIFDVRTGLEVSRVRAHELGAAGVRWAPDGATIWSGGLDGALRRWAVDP